MEQIVLSDMDAWESFADTNFDALVAEYGTVRNALVHACQGGLTLGGGAAPMFLITFED